MMKNVFIKEFSDFSLGDKRYIEYKQRIQRKREELNEDKIDEIVNIIIGFKNYKKEMAALRWVCNGKLILPEDIGKLDDAIELMNRFGLDYAKFDGPVELINSIPREKSMRVIDGRVNPVDYDELKLEYRINTGLGELSVYFVEDSRHGQLAIREIMNKQRGKDWKGPWCLLYGDGQGGLGKDAWGFWSKDYSGTKKRVAFLDGIIVAFCASYNNKPIWWDLKDNPVNGVPLPQIIKSGSTLEKVRKALGSKIVDIYNSIETKNIINNIYKDMGDKSVLKDDLFVNKYLFNESNGEIFEGKMSVNNNNIIFVYGNINIGVELLINNPDIDIFFRYIKKYENENSYEILDLEYPTIIDKHILIEDGCKVIIKDSEEEIRVHFSKNRENFYCGCYETYLYEKKKSVDGVSYIPKIITLDTVKVMSGYYHCNIEFDDGNNDEDVHIKFRKVGVIGDDKRIYIYGNEEGGIYKIEEIKKINGNKIERIVYNCGDDKKWDKYILNEHKLKTVITNEDKDNIGFYISETIRIVLDIYNKSIRIKEKYLDEAQ